jgi:hypothetical protein
MRAERRIHAIHPSDDEKDGEGKMTNKRLRTKGLTTLDEVLEKEGTREAFQAVAIKEVLAWQISEAMKAEG